MITFYTAVLYQLESLCIGLCVLGVWCLFTGQDMKVFYPATLVHRILYCYVFVLSFLIAPYLMMKYNWPRYGLWSYLYAINPWFCWVSIAVIFLGSALWWRFRQNKLVKE